MNRIRRILFITTLIVGGVLLFAGPAQAATLKDIRGTWAETAVTDLVQAGVVSGYPDGTFKPDRPVTRAEFAKMITKVYQLTPEGVRLFPDVRGHWAEQYINAVGQSYMTGYTDGTFRPDRNISRAEVTAVITRILKLGTDNEKPLKPWTPTFSDVPQSHWAFMPVEISNRLGILPKYESGFSPDRAASRAETAYVLSKARKLKTVTGTISAVDSSASQLAVLPSGGDIVEVPVDLKTSLFRNNVGTDIDSLIEGDEIRAVLGLDGTARYVKTYGEVNKNDLAARASSYLKGKITPAQIQSLLAGDWDGVKGNFKAELYDQLLKYGATPEEAETILMADWASLSDLGRQRLTTSIAAELGIDEVMVDAIMTQAPGGLEQLGNLATGGGGGTLLGQLMQMLPKLW